MLSPTDLQNFDILTRAFQLGQTCLLEVKRVSDAEVVSAICIVVPEGQDFLIAPLAILISGNPITQFMAPDPDGGFLPLGANP